ncbi:MAG: hypothetical protein QXU80_03925 [Zestosphaera sp.]
MMRVENPREILDAGTKILMNTRKAGVTSRLIRENKRRGNTLIEVNRYKNLIPAPTNSVYRQDELYNALP